MVRVRHRRENDVSPRRNHIEVAIRKRVSSTVAPKFAKRKDSRRNEVELGTSDREPSKDKLQQTSATKARMMAIEGLVNLSATAVISRDYKHAHARTHYPCGVNLQERSHFNLSPVLLPRRLHGRFFIRTLNRTVGLLGGPCET
jgi:hypothetical protein